MAALPTPPPSQPPHWPHWQANMQAMAATRHPSTFWEWPAVRHCMLTLHFPHGEQLLYLQSDAADWPRWEYAISDPDSEANQSNLIHQCYHLALWERTTNRRIDQLEVIYEFGGGYGAMALACKKLGFTGRYVIQDLDEFRILQTYFLSQRGVTVGHVTEPIESDLFVACFSLSETPLDFRAEFDKQLTAESYLLLTSAKWGDNGALDNMKWGRDFMAARNEKQWSISQYPGGRPDWYFIGY